MSMRIQHIILAFVFSLVVLPCLFAQSTITVRGRVSDENGEPAIGAGVVVSGTLTGTSTDADGRYSLTVKKGQRLIFSYLGYQDFVALVTDKNVIDVQLQPDVNLMDEIVVVGYGATRRSDLTGSVASVSAGKVEEFKASSVLGALGGQIAGVQVTASDGTPGAGFDIKIRGVGTINGDASPLYVVDGFQVDNIDYLASRDIESIEILKDASSSAIYGSRAANGVVLVTTKSGQIGRPVVTYNGAANYRVISKYLETLSPYDFVKLQVDAWPDRFSETYYKPGAENRYQQIDDYLQVPGVNWQKETFRPTWSSSHDLSVSGGTEYTKYTVAASSYNEKGIFVNSSYDKRTAKARVNQRITNRISLDATINYVFTDKRGTGTSADGGRFNMLAQILRARPTGGLRMTDEQLLAEAIDPLELESSESLSQVNPVFQANSTVNVRKAEMWNGNVSANIKLWKGFEWRSAITYSTTNTREYLFYQEGTKEAYRAGQKPYGQNLWSRNVRFSNFNYLTYRYTGKASHAFDVMAGHEYTLTSSENLLGQATDFPFDNLGNYNLNLGATPSKVSSAYSNKRLLSFFARGNYSYKNRYLLTATVRADGSSVFSEKRKWGVFPSFSLAWKIKEEKWMKRVRAVSTLKLRAGWGMVGNDRIPNYLSQDLYSQAKYGQGTDVLTVLQPKQLANENLRWEASESTNFGLDAGFWKDRLTFTVDVFRKDTRDLLMQATIPYASGFAYQWQNVGKIRNQGLEFTLRSVNMDTKGGFYWTTDINVSYVQNKLLAIAGDSDRMFTSAAWNSDYTGYDYVAVVGSAIGNIYGYKWDGVYQESDFIMDAATGKLSLKPGIPDITEHAGRPVAPGMVKYADVDGNGIITPEDRTVIGNGTPKVFGGLSNVMSYKGVDFSFMFQFSWGNQVYNATRIMANQTQDQRSNMLAEAADRWTKENASSTVPAWDGYIKNEIYSRFIEDGSFLRLKSVTLGYTFPKKLMSKIWVSKLRLYVSAQNLFVLTRYSGYDPEVNMRASNPMTPSLDWGAYPKSRVVTLGIDLSF